MMSTPIPSAGPAPLTGDLIFDAATSGYKWTLGADRGVDWSISGGPAGEFWTSSTAVQQQVAAMLDTFSYYANIRFNYVGSYSTPSQAAAAGSEMDFYPSASLTTFPSSSIWARAYFPTTTSDLAYSGAAGDVVLNINSAANSLSSYAPGSAGWFVFMHEIGHALGLKHPHDDGGTGHPTLTAIGLGDADIDWATMMSYADDNNWNLRAYDPSTPMILDVLALQGLYGPNTSTNAGDGVYNLTLTNRYMTIWDASGSDEVSAAGATGGWEIYLPDEQLSSLVSTRAGYAIPVSDLNLSSPHTLYWLTGDIEDATGSQFADNIYGSVLDNFIAGNGGADYLIGWDGADTIDAGAGDDEAYGGIGNDVIVDDSGSNYLRGDEGNDQIFGGTGFDDINGNMGNDTASGGAGDDWVVGGRDNDLLGGADGDDIVYGNLGNDSCAGEAGNDLIRGGQQDDVILGGAGNDWISGDRDNDTMSGGTGADIFHTFGGAGIDRVTDFSLVEGDRVQLDPGTVYTLAQVGADTVINMTGGGQMILVGVSMTSLTGNWIFGA